MFVPKRRKKKISGALRKHLGEIFRELGHHKESAHNRHSRAHGNPEFTSVRNMSTEVSSRLRGIDNQWSRRTCGDAGKRIQHSYGQRFRPNKNSKPTSSALCIGCKNYPTSSRDSFLAPLLAPMQMYEALLATGLIYFCWPYLVLSPSYTRIRTPNPALLNDSSSMLLNKMPQR